MEMIYGLAVDTNKGFDLLTLNGEVKEHFATYEEADKARKQKGGIVRYYLAKEA